MKKSPAKLALVVPCYNEAVILQDTISQLGELLGRLIAQNKISADSFALFCDDGSTDDTWKLISDAHDLAPERIAGLKLSGNRGHQFALLAGLMQAKECADCAVSLDADLQDDINVIGEFIDEYDAGCDIVYGVRSDRSSDSFFKRVSAESFYRLLAAMGVKTVYNHADFRLMSKRALEALGEFREVNVYLRGIVPLIGFKQGIVCYTRKPAARPTHYPLTKMLLLAWDGITSFSIRPIRMITAMGMLMAVVSVAFLIYSLVMKFYGQTVPGWTSLVFVMLLLGGMQLLSIGVIGEYIGKIYMESKHRPRYIVEQLLKGDRKP